MWGGRSKWGSIFGYFCVLHLASLSLAESPRGSIWEGGRFKAGDETAHGFAEAYFTLCFAVKSIVWFTAHEASVCADGLTRGAGVAKEMPSVGALRKAIDAQVLRLLALCIPPQQAPGLRGMLRSSTQVQRFLAGPVGQAFDRLLLVALSAVEISARDFTSKAAAAVATLVAELAALQHESSWEAAELKPLWVRLTFNGYLDAG